MNTQLILIALIGVLAVAFAAWLCQQIRKQRQDGTRLFCNIAEGEHTNGVISFKATAAISTRFNIVKIGADAAHVAVSAASAEAVLGVCYDEPGAVDEYCEVAILGNYDGTMRVRLGGTVAFGDQLMSNGDGTAVLLVTGAGKYQIGVALQAGVSGDTIEFQHCVPIHRPT